MTRQRQTIENAPSALESKGGEVAAAGRPETAAPPPHNGVALRRLNIDTPVSEWPTSLDRRNRAHRALIFGALNPADVKLETGATVDFRAKDWLYYVDERLDPETGELRQMATLVLFDSAGRMFKTSSAFAPRRLQAAISLYSAEEWSAGITFRVTSRKSATPGRYYHDIRIVEDTLNT